MNVLIFKPTNELIGKIAVATLDEIPAAIERFLKDKGPVPVCSYVEASGKAWTIMASEPFRLEEGRHESPQPAGATGLTPNPSSTPNATATGSTTPHGFEFEVWYPDGNTQVYRALNELKVAVESGKVRRNFRARYDKPGSEANKVSEPGEWPTISEISKTAPEIRQLFRPISALTAKGIQYGILTGIVLKALDTTYTLFSVDPAAGVMWVATVGAILLSSKFKWYPIAIVLFLGFKLGIRANFFVTAIAAALVGALFGAPGGAAIGTTIGIIKAKRLGKVMDLEDEGFKPYLQGLVIPLVFLAFALPFYVFWLTPKFMEWAH